jgi:stage II sporulation protein D
MGRILAIFIMCLFVQKAMGEPIYPLNNDYKPLARGTTARIFEDWASDKIAPENLPDRSFRNLWVRMFPLMSVPLGDPYPQTVNPNALTLVNSGGLSIYGLDDGAPLATGKILTFDFIALTVNVDGTLFALEPLWIVPQGAMTTTMGWDKGAKLANGKSAEVKVELRGGFVIKPTLHKINGGTQTLWSGINVVTVNEYLQAVVPSEVIASWKTETLRAQAIAARTYGMYEVAHSRADGDEYDLDPTTWFQSYQGLMFWNRDAKAWRHVELASTTAAVAATGDKVIVNGSEVIKAYFSSHSGGRTCTAGECFETGVDLPYLREVDDAPGIQSSPGGTWGTRANLTPATIKAKLKEYGVEFNGTVKKLEHLERGPSRRTWRLRILLTNGGIVNLDRLSTRKVMHLFGPIRSFQYELGSVSGGHQKITGHGYGHGVGMSQWGAQLYAKAGWNAERILQHFYYNVTIKSP